jgi:ADP-dependent NAD(P)H-hydrate dehydratase / NAD(P)H-hydrate epimerase
VQPLSSPLLTAAQMRDAEAAVIAAGTSVDELMERAGAAVAQAVWRFGGGQSVLILCGPGNNGGDGYVAARLLSERGVSVTVAASGEPRTDAALAARQSFSGVAIALEEAKPAPILVDALFGTGLSRPLDSVLAKQLATLAEAAQFVIAVDLPSGVNSDTGALLGATPADLTLALGHLKPAHLLQPGAQLCGRVVCADIGVPATAAVSVLERPKLVAPDATAHKYSRGSVGIVGGAMAGAAQLAARAAMPLSGYVALAYAKRIGPDALVHKRWEDLAADARLGALLIGPGLGRDDKALGKLGAALATAHPLVLDADALILVGGPERLKSRGGTMILTPHGGEFDALFGKSEASKIDRAVAAASASGAVIIFKGSDSVIAAPDGRVAVSPGAPGWLASAGTGDVLAGIASALLASGLPPFEAACAAVWLHSEAARLAGPALTADDLPRFLPFALAQTL